MNVSIPANKPITYLFFQNDFPVKNVKVGNQKAECLIFNFPDLMCIHIPHYILHVQYIFILQNHIWQQFCRIVQNGFSSRTFIMNIQCFESFKFDTDLFPGLLVLGGVRLDMLAQRTGVSVPFETALHLACVWLLSCKTTHKVDHHINHQSLLHPAIGTMAQPR